MKLISLRLRNFRQFYGTTPEIYFAAGERNTTVIYGNNGAGKTTLLNSFTWVLYERFTAAFAKPEMLINKRALYEVDTGTAVDCWVELCFERDSKQYRLKRQCFAHRDPDKRIQYSQSKFFMQLAGDDGLWYLPTQQPTDIIQGILPESLHQYFFFDGERIEHIFRYSDRTSTIAEDTKELLGVKVLDRAIEHLKKAKRTLQNELKGLGNTQTQKLIREQTKLEGESDRLTERQEEVKTAIAHQENLKQTLNQHWLELGGAPDLQQLKEQLETKEVSDREALLMTKASLKQLLSSRAYTVFMPSLIVQFKNLVTELRSEGVLPTGVKKQFIQDLLTRQTCLCGTILQPETLAYQQVQSWLEKAGFADIEEAVIRTETQVGEVEQRLEDFWQESDRLSANLQQQRENLAILENQLDDLRQKLRTYPDTDIQHLQKQIDEVEVQIRQLTLEQGANQQQIAQIQKAIAVQNKQISKHQQKEAQQELIQRQITATEGAIICLREVRDRLETQFRYSLEQRVQEIFSSISFTPYLPRLNADYELSLVENTSGIAFPVAASTGENQILSLSFIGGIIDRVRQWSQRNTLMGPDSSTFPVVMDSPFGSLDEIYRRQVAHYIPQLANQLVMLVTKTQWRGEVATEVQQSIGKEYVLVYNSPKSDCEVDSLQIGDRFYPLVQPSQDEFEYTEILEIAEKL
ncbi:MAG: AAA family ATPase [Jaaginema sp. PMC 1079.18]|nr:AAA family ATPase [Jaaginema sp. PMC 1080.18]MEC4850550.1 AAA family ATPase [Jaaginema sp. PMC 1079.18]MEC4865478.1 AAA family ATPase [Jaaginema sp. PMC 1078.18]